MSYRWKGGEDKWGIVLSSDGRPRERTEAEGPDRPKVDFCEGNRRTGACIRLRCTAGVWEVGGPG